MAVASHATEENISQVAEEPVLVPVLTVPKASTKTVQALRNVLLVPSNHPVKQVNILRLVVAGRIMGVPVIIVTAIHTVPVEP